MSDHYHSNIRHFLTDPPKVMDASMPNTDAYALGKLALTVGRMHVAEGVGDEIDRGLILVRLLREKGYTIVKQHPTSAESK